MAGNGIELGNAYISINARTDAMAGQIKAALNGSAKVADQAGADLGARLSKSASKAMRDGWRPDQDIMAGIPDTKLDRIGARIGQVIGKGIAGGMRAHEAGAQFAHSFAEGAGSVGIGRIIAGWRTELTGGGALASMGMLAGKTFSAALTGAIGVGVAGAGLALTKGFERLMTIDSSKIKLKALGKTTQEITDIVKTVTDSVTGTPYALDTAFGTAVMAIGGGTKDIGKFMKDVTDAAGFAGVDLERMGVIFTQVLAKGKLQGEDMLQLMEAGLPAKSWIEQSYNLTSDQFDKMQQKGEITMDMLQKSIEDHAGGMAKAAGDSLQGAIGNMQTAIARVGADFLSAVFGGPSGDPTEGMKDAVKRLSDMLNNLDNWIKAHRDDIRQFFTSAKDAAAGLADVLGKILGYLKEHPGAIQAVVVAFAAFEGIKGVAELTTSVLALNTALGTTATLAGAVLGPIAAIAAAAGGLAAAVKDTPLDINTGPLAGPFSGIPTTQGGQPFQVGGPSNPNAQGPSGAGSNSFGYLTGGQPMFGGYPGAQAERRGAAAPSSFSGPKDVADYIYNKAKAAGYSDQQANWFIIQAAGESGFSPGANGGNQDGTGAVGGIFQFTPGTWGNRPGSMWNAKDNIDQYFNLAQERGLNPQDFQSGTQLGTQVSIGGPWHPQNAAKGHLDNAMRVAQPYLHVGTYDSGGKLKPGLTLAQNNTGQDEHVLTGSQLESMRTQGYIPAAAGNMGKAGDSTVAKGIAIGGEIINGIIDQAASAASSAAGMGVNAIAPGAGGAASGAASAAIGLGANAAKRGVTYGFNMLGIGADSLLQQIMPFGMPRWLSTDPGAFMPNMDITGALGNLMSQGAAPAAPAAGGNRTPEAMAGQDPLGGAIRNLANSSMPQPPPAGWFGDSLRHGTAEGAAPGPNPVGADWQNSANSFLSTELAQQPPAPGGPNPSVVIQNAYAQDPNELSMQIQKRQNLAAMQYTGRPGP